MDRQRLLELAGVQLNEGPPKTTWENPLVTVWDSAESKDYPEQGLSGHMHLTTAQNIHQFKIDGLADEVKKAGVGKRVKAGKKWLEMSKWTKKEIDAGGQAEAVKAEKKDLKESVDPDKEFVAMTFKFKDVEALIKDYHKDGVADGDYPEGSTVEVTDKIAQYWVDLMGDAYSDLAGERVVDAEMEITGNAIKKAIKGK